MLKWEEETNHYLGRLKRNQLHGFQNSHSNKEQLTWWWWSSWRLSWRRSCSTIHKTKSSQKPIFSSKHYINGNGPEFGSCMHTSSGSVAHILMFTSPYSESSSGSKPSTSDQKQNYFIHCLIEKICSNTEWEHSCGGNNTLR